jgi:hypothetical protein
MDLFTKSACSGGLVRGILVAVVVRGLTRVTDMVRGLS